MTQKRFRVAMATALRCNGIQTHIYSYSLSTRPFLALLFLPLSCAHTLLYRYIIHTARARFFFYGGDREGRFVSLRASNSLFYTCARARPRFSAVAFFFANSIVRFLFFGPGLFGNGYGLFAACALRRFFVFFFRSLNCVECILYGKIYGLFLRPDGYWSIYKRDEWNRKI